MPKKQKKRPRRHFKVNLERIARHIGEIADNTSFKDIQSITLDIALAYAGYKAFNNWSGALVGPISLRLALAPGGTPPVSQISGVAGLATLGVALSSDYLKELVSPAFHLADVWAADRDVKAVPPWEHCPPGYRYTHSGMFWKFCTKVKVKEE